jgi:hypothetical protein
LAKISLFGFKLGKDTPAQEVLPSFSPPVLDDGAVTITAAAHYGTSIDLDSNYKNDVELITRYREMAMQPEIESAVDDIINEAIIQEEESAVEINLDKVKVSPKVKNAIEEEFENILTLLNFKNLGQDIFRRFYVDGRLYYNIILDKDNTASGIQELRYTDPRKLTKIREIKKIKDKTTGHDIIQGYQEYYIYSEVISTKSNLSNSGLRIAPDSIIAVTSGLLDSKRSIILSYLHKAIKPLNQLRMIEDATVIYKVSRAPERRIFYIDVGNLPKMKAEQYLKDIMTKYKNKVVYDANTGEVRDDRKYLSMMEDFWLPRRSDNKSTEITTLPSSAAFDDMSMVEYFEKKLYKALGVPFSRLEQPDSPYDIGNSDQISRDEIKFDKFINRLRLKFSDLFDQALKVQCYLKGICTEEEFEEYKQNIFYDFKRDNNYAELKESQLLQNRVNVLTLLDPYVGKYYSQQWIQTNVLQFDDDDIKLMAKQIDEEIKQGLYPDPKLANDPALLGGMGGDPNAIPGAPVSDQGQPADGDQQDSQDQQDLAPIAKKQNKPAKADSNKQDTNNPYYNV